MQRIVELRAWTLAHNLQRTARGVLGVCQPFGNKHLPLRKTAIHGIKPSVNASFTRIDFLATPDKADDDSPIFVSVHVRNQKLRLGIRKARLPFFAQHKTRGLLQIPSALRFIEDHDVLNRWTRINQRVIAEVVNVLDESFDAFTDFPFANFLALLPSARDFIARQRFTKNRDERTVS